MDLLPHPEKDHLRDVPRVFGVAHDATGERDHRRRLARYERLEADHVAAARPDGQIPVGELRRPLPFEPFAVDEFHSVEKGLLLPDIRS